MLIENCKTKKKKKKQKLADIFRLYIKIRSSYNVLPQIHNFYFRHSFTCSFIFNKHFNSCCFNSKHWL